MHRPIVLWTGLLSLGIAADGLFGLSVATWLICVGIAAILTVYAIGRLPLAAVAAALIVFFAGGWWHAFRADMLIADGLDRYVDAGPVVLHGVVVRLPEEADDRTYYVLKLMSVQSEAVKAYVRLTVVGDAEYRYGDVLQVRALLRRPESAANPGGFNYRAHLQRQGVTAIAFVQYARHVERVGVRRLNPLIHWAEAVRTVVRRGLFAALPESTARFVAGIALGDRRSVPPLVAESFRRTGISHLLAVSGMHVGFVAFVWGALLRPLRLPRWLFSLLAIGVVCTYVLVTGARPPAVRAGVAAVCGVIGFVVEERPDGWTTLALAGLVLLLHNPLLLFDVGFQLSFAASAGILVGFRPLKQRLRLLPKPLATAVAVAIAAHGGVLPLLARTFFELSTVSLIVGTLITPLVAIIIPPAIGAGLLHFMWPALAYWPAAAVHWLTGTLLGFVRWIAEWPLVSVPVLRPSLSFVGMFWIVAVLSVRGRDWPPRRRRRWAAIAACLLLWSIWSNVWSRPRTLQVTMLDVGQGDAIFIRTPSGATALVDGGGTWQGIEEESGRNVGTDVIVPFLRHTGVRRINVVINTHPHEDHLQGLLPILADYDVQIAVDSGQRTSSVTFHRYLQLIEQKGIRRLQAVSGDVIWLDRDVFLHVLHPQRLLLDGTRSDLNNNSVVIKLAYKNTAVLLTGDIEAEAQLALLRNGAPLAAHVVKVPHHGSRLALVTAFYEKVSPEVAVIAVGHNSHGHPSPEVVDTLHRLGAAVYRTDVHGAIQLISDGDNWSVRTFRRTH